MNRLLASVFALAVASPALAQTPPTLPSCAEDPLYRQQDFTLGEWDVFKNGTKSAEVNIAHALGGCALQETWKPAAPGLGHGLGLFSYSRLLKHWSYTWVSDQAATQLFQGDESKPGEMVYTTDKPLPSGGIRHRRWTLTREPDGTIRELSVGTDDGKTWTTEYELIWHRKS